MNQRSEHLSNAQIEQYGKRASGAGPETEAWVETHLDDCPSCRSRVLEFQRTQFALLPDPKVNTVSSPNCPSEDDLRTLAAGLCSDPLAAELSAHAAACAHCGPLLREYQEDFSDDVTPEEQTALAQLRSASPKWQRQKAREMLKQVRTTLPRPSPRWTFAWRWALIPAAAAACAAIAVSIWYTQRVTPEKVEKLLAQAYTEQRPMEMRWPGAEWGVIKTTRGQTDHRIHKSSALIHAEQVIARNRKHSDSADWVRAEAEVRLLESRPDLAIASLRNALAFNPHSTALTMDLAIAYFQDGLTNGDKTKYDQAVNLLTSILQKDATNTTALFNRALAYEALQMPESAHEDWSELVQLERDQAWVEEARKRLSRK